ncbi:MAG: hypothetical protein H0T51_07515 [Pirellulales bacterium]|nr:hypothetical protein [Pirellulales bacterium]
MAVLAFSPELDMFTRAVPILTALALFGWAHTAEAAPIAQYNPSTGGIYFSGITNSSLLELYKSGPEPLIFANAIGPNPNHPQAGIIQWRSTVQLDTSFAMDFFAGSVVPPGTTASQLGFAYLITGNRSPVTGQVVQIPEPTGVALAGSCLVWFGLLRRRPA